MLGEHEGGLMSKDIVIYHKNCTDGFAAAWAFWQAWGEEMDYHAASHGSEPPDVTGRTVYMLDFCYKREVMESLLEEAAGIVLLDHHKTAIEDMGDLSHPRFDMSECSLDHSGCRLAWDYVSVAYKRPRPRLIDHIEDRDLWRFRLTGTEEICAALHSYEMDFGQWDTLMNVSITELWREGVPILRAHKKRIREIASSAKRDVSLAGKRVPLVNCPGSFMSDVGDSLSPHHPFVAMYYDTKYHRVFGLRSREYGGDDVSEVARLYGGGGHRNASGFRVPRDHHLAGV